jgi:ribosome-binding ATPase YchF (GTP1/OBG family)
MTTSIRTALTFATTSAFMLALSLGMVGCKTDTAGVSTNAVQQWTMVNGDIEAATDAAEEVLEDYDLLNVEAKTTKLDGTVTGEKADGTEVAVDIREVTDDSSEVTVRVGTLGDNDLGTEIADKIKSALE